MKQNSVVVLMEGHEEIADEGITFLQENGHTLYFANSVSSLSSDERLKSSTALLVRGAIIDKNIIAMMPHLKVIARAGVGTDNIDIAAATEKGIIVCNVPDANFNAVTEHVLGLMLSLAHQIPNGDKELRQGRFDARHRYVGTEVSGKTIGIIGFGRIGQLLARKCSVGLDMNVLVYDPYVDARETEGIEWVQSLDDILTRADFVSLHLPYIPTLHHFISEAELSQMKETAYLINCARGGLVDEKALARAIEQGEIAGAAIDVFEQEPPEPNHILFGLKAVVVTPHMGASTKEALIKMGVTSAKEIHRVLSNERPKHALNYN